MGVDLPALHHLIGGKRWTGHFGFLALVSSAVCLE
jgi:hypothetical protein